MALTLFSVRFLLLAPLTDRPLNIFYAGEVVEGFDLVKKIEGFGSSGGKTSAKIKIASCGVV